TISPRMVNDFRFGYHKSLYSSVNFFTSESLAGAGTALGIPGFTSSLANPGIPDFEITGFVAVGGQNMTSSNWTRPDSTFVFTDVLNYTVGAHSIATGAEFYRLTTGSQGQNASRGLFNFTGGISGNAAADFLLGLPLNVTSPGIGRPVQARQSPAASFTLAKWDATHDRALAHGL